MPPRRPRSSSSIGPSAGPLSRLGSSACCSQEFCFSSRRRHTRSVSAFLLNRSSDLHSFPSECHADYFDFERIEALKPAIEACGISTLSQSPMLGFHKQMDNRIKLLEEILSFRMQGVEFDNGDRSEERRVGKECRSWL